MRINTAGQTYFDYSIRKNFLISTSFLCWDKEYIRIPRQFSQSIKKWSKVWVRPISLVLISYLAVLFVPAGVGIMLHIDRLKNEALPIGVSLIVSTILTIAVTALVIKYSTIWLQKRKEQKEARRQLPQP